MDSDSRLVCVRGAKADPMSICSYEPFRDMMVCFLSRRIPEDVTVVKSALHTIYGQGSSYSKYVLRKFHHAIVYIQDDEVVGLSVWRNVPRDISKQNVVERYLNIMVLHTKHADINLRAKIVGDIEQFCVDRGIQSMLLESPTQDEGRLYQYLGFLIVSVFPSVYMQKMVGHVPELYLPSGFL